MDLSPRIGDRLVIQGRDFLKVAEELIAGSTEAQWRSAVSRGYYAAFHVARRLLTECGFKVPRGERAHSYLWLRLGNTGNLTVDIAGARLNTRRGERNQADYDLDRNIDQTTAATQVRADEEVIRTFESVATEPLRTQVTEAIKVYERDVLREVTWHAP
jgi:uncharacterized protein (UPF0332 family)